VCGPASANGTVAAATTAKPPYREKPDLDERTAGAQRVPDERDEQRAALDEREDHVGAAEALSLRDGSRSYSPAPLS
jgi:hypothetical protein